MLDIIIYVAIVNLFNTKCHNTLHLMQNKPILKTVPKVPQLYKE